MTETEPSETEPSETRDDLRDLHRGALVNALGYVLKLLNPILLAVVTRVYGETQWGVFVTIQATYLLAARVALLGLDKAVLWWIPRTTPANAKEGLGGVLLWVLVTSALATFCLGWLLPWTASHIGFAESAFLAPTHLRTLRWIAASLPVFTISEVLIHATMGRRKMGVQVLVKGTLVPLLIFAIALALFWTPLRADGIGIAFFISQLVGLGASAWAFNVLFRQSPWTNTLRVPRPMVRYALPMWGSEFANTLFQRLDIFFLTALAGPAAVGIWGVLVQIGNQFRAIRQAFDPIAIAVTSSVSAEADRTEERTEKRVSAPSQSALDRLRTAFNRAVFLVALVQVPVVAAIFWFASPLLSIFGEQFPEGTLALRILLLGWFAAGVFGLSGTVVVGFGRSGWTLIALMFSIALQSALLSLSSLAPGFRADPLTHIAVASCAGLTIHNAVHIWLARRAIGGASLYLGSAFRPVRDGLIAACAGLALHALAGPIAGFAAFALVYATLQKAWQRIRGLMTRSAGRSELR